MAHSNIIKLPAEFAAQIKQQKLRGMESQIPSSQAAQQKEVVTTAEFMAKYRSKPEVFRFLSFDVGAYLPPYGAVTVWHLRDLAGGKRKFIKAD